MQTASFLSTALTSKNTKGRTFSAKVFNLEELGWDFENDGFTDLDENEYVTIDVDQDGATYYLPNQYSGLVRRETGDDAQTIKDLETLRAAHQLEEA